MSLFDDLLRQLEEALEGQRRTALPGRAPPRIQRPSQPPAARPVIVITEDEPEPTRRTVADSAPVPPVSARHPDHPLVALLRDPAGVRNAVLLSEILRRPRWGRRR